MFIRSLVGIILILIYVSLKNVWCVPPEPLRVQPTSGNKTKINLQMFLDDLTVAAHSMHYTVSLNKRLLENLKTRLQNNEVSCDLLQYDFYDGQNEEAHDDYLGKDSRVKYFHVRDKTYGLVRSPQTWNEARKTCTSIGGKLVDLQSQSQGEVLGQNFERIKVKKNEIVFVGIHSLFENNEWVTITGDPVAQSLKLKLMSNSTSDNGSSPRNCGVLIAESIHKADCDEKHIAICKL